MGRKLKITKGVFHKAYRIADSMMELGADLGVSIPTIYNYCAIYGLDPISEAKDIDWSLHIFDCFKGKTTITDLSKQFKMSRQMIRYHLVKAIKYKWSTEKMKFPYIHKLDHIKIMHILIGEPHLYEDPDNIAARIGSTLYIVEQYLEEIFKLKTKTKKKTKKKKRNK